MLNKKNTTEYSQGYDKAVKDIKNIIIVNHASVDDWVESNFSTKIAQNMQLCITEPLFVNLIDQINHLSTQRSGSNL